MVTKEQVDAALVVQEYRYAKTMPWCPHWYCLRKAWKTAVDFEQLVQFMRDHGYRERFQTERMRHPKFFIRYNVGRWKYWTCGDTLPNTILINRCPIDENVRVSNGLIQFGDRWLPPAAWDRAMDNHGEAHGGEDS